MEIIFAFLLVSWNPMLFFAGFILVAGWLVWYALYKKGDVRAEFSHGRTTLKLEARERDSDRK